MIEPYDWTKDQEDWQTGSASLTPTPVSAVPAIRLQMPPQERPERYYHGPGCRCPVCDDRPVYQNASAAPSTAGAPLLDKVIALVVAFAALVLGSYLLLPLLMAFMTFIIILAVVCVSALAILLGIVRAVTGHIPRRQRDKV